MTLPFILTGHFDGVYRDFEVVQYEQASQLRL
jgi:hypothetical protein